MSFEVADIPTLKSSFESYEVEASRAWRPGSSCLRDYVLKCSHSFNVLDARGAFGAVTRGIHGQCGRCAEGGRGLGKKGERGGGARCGRRSKSDTSRDTEAAGAAAAQSLSGWDAVLEIGTEEMPARFAAGLIRQAEEGCYRLLADAHVESGGVKCYTTPRRIIVAITGLAPKQAPLEVELRGPAARIAYDAEGKPTRALEGFARSAGVSVDSVERRTTEAGEYVFARKTEEGRPTIEVLAEIFPKLIDAFSFPKAMRWGSNDSGLAGRYAGS